MGFEPPTGYFKTPQRPQCFWFFFYALCPETLAMTVDNWGAFGERRKRVYI